MKYAIMVRNQPVKNDNGALIVFKSVDDARHWAINHLDLSKSPINIYEIQCRKYIVQKHEKGLAIITWCFDEDYTPCSPHMMHIPDGIYYTMLVDIYDIEGNVINQDSISGIHMEHQENTEIFREEMLNAYEFHFTTLVTT